jgi:formamidopyrimidine-DNA glycosylase
VPELPEVERGRRLAEAVARGRRIDEVVCTADDIVFDGVSPRRMRNALRGKTVLAVHRRGKQLWFELDHPPHPLFHFGMSGGFYVPPSDHPDAAPLQLKSGPKVASAGWPPRFTKICIELADGGALAMADARRLGRILLRRDPLRESPLKDLGFDAHLAMPSPGEFSRALRRRSGKIKSLLLDQHFMAGVGNWIADEALFQARIDPRRRASSLSAQEGERLGRRLARIIRTAVQANADDAAYPRSWLFHRRWGRREGSVTASGSRIEHVVIGGRTTAWVPAVQR